MKLLVIGTGNKNKYDIERSKMGINNNLFYHKIRLCVVMVTSKDRQHGPNVSCIMGNEIKHFDCNLLEALASPENCQ